MTMYIILLLFCPLLIVADPDLPQPRIVILGQTGVGKSTLANVLIGENVECTNCEFSLCKGLESCTNKTTFASEAWLGEGPVFTIVDTPGFGDSQSHEMENTKINEMLNVLKTSIKGANAIILLFNGEQIRFDHAFQQTIREIEARFGESFWNFTIIGVSHWAFDSNSIFKRNITGNTEEWYLAEWNKQLKEKFNPTKDLPGVFIDVMSQLAWVQDPGQQEVFEKETGKLWAFAEQNELFPFKTIEDVLEENRILKGEVQWLNDVITNNISEILNQMDDLRDQDSELEKDISSVRTELTEDITILTQHTSANISTAKAELAEDICSVRTELKEDIQIFAQHTSENISVVKTEVEEDIDSVRRSLNVYISTVKSELKRDISSVEEDIEYVVPVGTISAWTPSPDSNNQDHVDLPECYVPCDGSEITEGIWKGRRTPDLNNPKRFLRGGHVSDALKFEEDSLQEHSHTSTVHDPGHKHGHTISAPNWSKDGLPDAIWDQPDVGTIMYDHRRETDHVGTGISMSVTEVTGARKGSETKPKNMNVVFVMKVC